MRKTLLNGWATSHRKHEDSILDCVLGCKNASDSLTRYVHCPHLFAIQRYLFEDISDDPLIRFGSKAPEFSNLKVLSCVFTAYHALKGDIRAGRINMHSVSWLNASWSLFANVIKAEAGEMHLNTRSFSLRKFINFLVTGRTSGLAVNSVAHDPH